MIQLYKNTVSEFNDLVDIISIDNNPDFYITENNQRILINNDKTLRKLIKQSNLIYYVNDFDIEAKGLIAIVKGKSENVERNYIKILASDYYTVIDLLTVFSWNCGKEVYIKLHKNSPYLKAFYSKGFKFNGGRGEQVLLKRDKRIIVNSDKIHMKDKEEINALH